jgi:hypothetical protein
MSPRPIEEVRPLEEVCPLAHTATGPTPARPVLVQRPLEEVCPLAHTAAGPTPARPVLVQRPLEEVCPLAPPRRGLSTCTHCGRPGLPGTPRRGLSTCTLQAHAHPNSPSPRPAARSPTTSRTSRRGLSTCTSRDSPKRSVHLDSPGLTEEVCLPAHSRPTPTQIHPALVQRPARPPHREEVCLLASRPSSSVPLADRLPHIPKRSVHLHTLSTCTLSPGPRPATRSPTASRTPLPKRSVYLHTLWPRPTQRAPSSSRTHPSTPPRRNAAGFPPGAVLRLTNDLDR